MKKLDITYHMYRPGESAETCITLPMTDDYADLKLHDFRTRKWPLGLLGRIVDTLALLQGYEYAEIVHMKEAGTDQAETA